MFIINVFLKVIFIFYEYNFGSRHFIQPVLKEKRLPSRKYEMLTAIQKQPSLLDVRMTLSQMRPRLKPHSLLT